jgi:hypothetical protein
VDKLPVSELCEELGLRPTVFYRWQKELFENGAAAFQCYWLHHAEGRAGGASAGDPRRTRPQAGSRQTATSESPPASRVKNEAASHRDVGQPGKAILTHSRMSDISVSPTNVKASRFLQAYSTILVGVTSFCAIHRGIVSPCRWREFVESTVAKRVVETAQVNIKRPLHGRTGGLHNASAEHI